MAQWKTLSVPLVTQENSQWCWSASSKAVLNFYAKTPSQCQIVNWAFGLNYACGNTTFASMTGRRADLAYPQFRGIGVGSPVDPHATHVDQQDELRDEKKPQFALSAILNAFRLTGVFFE